MTLKREIKRLPFEVKEFTQDENYFYFEGYASTFGNVDHGNDVIVKGAFAESLKVESEVPLLWQHNMSKPIGISVELREDEKGLFIKGRISIRTTLGKDAAVLLEDKVIKEMSIGFFSKETDMIDNIRYIKEIQLYEVSVVTKAMNSQALIKSFESLKEVEQSLKELGLSNTEAKTLIAKVKEFSSQCDAEEKEKSQRDADAEEKELIAQIKKSEEINQLNTINKLFNSK
tara:strand:+ start:262 stop:951 length:690 start_codon:yes stop_codon:yes gene_type:complete